MPLIRVYVRKGRGEPAVLAGEVEAASGELEFADGRGVLRGGAKNEMRQLLELYCGGAMESDFGMVYEGATLESCRINRTVEHFEFTYSEPTS